MTDLPTQSSSFLTLSESPKNSKSIHLQTVVALSLQISLAPHVEVLGLNLFGDIEANQVLVLVVLVHKVHGMSVPFTQRVTLAFSSIVAHYFNKLLDALFKILHVFGTALNLLNGLFGAHIEGLSKNLEEKLGCKETHMGLISSNNLLAFSIHAAHIVFIAIVKLVHLSDQIVTFVSEGSQIVFKPSFLALGVEGSLTHLFKLVVKVSQSVAVTFVLSL